MAVSRIKREFKEVMRSEEVICSLLSIFIGSSNLEPFCSARWMCIGSFPIQLVNSYDHRPQLVVVPSPNLNVCFVSCQLLFVLLLLFLFSKNTFFQIVFVFLYFSKMLLPLIILALNWCKKSDTDFYLFSFCFLQTNGWILMQ